MIYTSTNGSVVNANFIQKEIYKKLLHTVLQMVWNKENQFDLDSIKNSIFLMD